MDRISDKPCRNGIPCACNFWSPVYLYLLLSLYFCFSSFCRRAVTTCDVSGVCSILHHAGYVVCCLFLFLFLCSFGVWYVYSRGRLSPEYSLWAAPSIIWCDMTSSTLFSQFLHACTVQLSVRTATEPVGQLDTRKPSRWWGLTFFPNPPCNTLFRGVNSKRQVEVVSKSL